MTMIGKDNPTFPALRRAFRSETLRAAFTEAVERGCAYRVTGSTHVLLTLEGRGYSMSTTASGRSAVQNTLAQMRRRGMLKEARK